MGRDALRLRRAQAWCERDFRRTCAVVPQAPRLLQVPALRRVRRDPEDEHREDPEIQAARAGEGGEARLSRYDLLIFLPLPKCDLSRTKGSFGRRPRCRFNGLMR